MLLTHEDIAPLVGEPVDWEVIDIYISDVWAQAVAEAPCLSGALSAEKAAAAKAILRQAVLRWWRAGEGGVTTTQETAGPFSQSTTFAAATRGEGRLFDGEIKRLQRLCVDAGTTRGRKAFSIMPRLG